MLSSMDSGHIDFEREATETMVLGCPNLPFSQMSVDDERDKTKENLEQMKYILLVPSSTGKLHTPTYAWTWGSM